MQVVHGGEGPNRTVQRICDESTLVATYHNIHKAIKDNLSISRKTTAHTDPNMRATYAALANHMEEFRTHVFVPGRDTTHYIRDLLEEGINVFSAAKNQATDGDNDENDINGDQDINGEALLDEDDLAVEDM